MASIIFKFVWFSIKILIALSILFSCAACSLTFVITAKLADTTTKNTVYQGELKESYDHEDIAGLLYASSNPTVIGGYHGSVEGYYGYDYSAGYGAALHSPLPGTGVVSYNGLDGYVGIYAKGKQNTMITITGDSGEVTLFHGNYNLVTPGDVVVGGITRIGTESDIGNATGPHSHIVWNPNPNWQPVIVVDGNYNDIIVKYSSIYNLNPSVVHGLVKQESNYDPNAVSGAGAKGLMQIMPITQQDQCPLVNLFDPEQNIACGTKHLRWTFDQMGDEGQLGIMAYHSGVTAQKTRGATSLDIYYYKQIMGYSE